MRLDNYSSPPFQNRAPFYFDTNAPFRGNILPYQITCQELVDNLARLKSLAKDRQSLLEQDAIRVLVELEEACDEKALSDDQALSYTMVMIGLLDLERVRQEGDFTDSVMAFLKQHIFPNCADSIVRDKADQAPHDLSLFDDLTSFCRNRKQMGNAGKKPMM